ncbi:helix-turn-helix domain-containing protein [Nonomuraea angiospora]|uniref:helix-turn-helix domain-containing protein n=1 Tax=Nonomuraea angiospora TaxID=46172 RepID=UPI003EB6ED13
MASLIKRYKGGEGLPSLARAYGRNAATLRRWLCDAGVEMRRRGRPRTAARAGL